MLCVSCCSGFPLVAASRDLFSCGAQASHRSGFSCWRARALGRTVSVVAAPGLWSTGPAVVQGLSCSLAYGIFLDQGSDPSLLHWQETSPLSHQGSPFIFYCLWSCARTVFVLRTVNSTRPAGSSPRTITSLVLPLCASVVSIYDMRILLVLPSQGCKNR